MEKVIELNHYINKAESLAHTGNPDLAMIYFKKSVRLDANESLLYILWAQCTQNPDLKVNRYASAASIQPNSTLIIQQWASALEKQGKYEEAEKVYLKGMESTQNASSQAILAYIEFLYRNERFEEAIKMSRTEYEKRPKSVSFANNLGYLLLNTGEYKEAIILFQKVIEMNSDHLQPYLNWCIALLQMNELEKAENVIQEIREKNRRNEFFGIRDIINFYKQDLVQITGHFNKETDEVKRSQLQKRMNGINFMLNQLKDEFNI